MTAISRWPQFTIETQGKGQIVIILYKAYLLGFLLDFLKLYMGILLLSKPDPMVVSAYL